MKIFSKRSGAFLTASALALGLIAVPVENIPFSFGSAVSALEQPAPAYASLGQKQSLPDSKELERLYIDQLFYGGGVSFYKDYGKNYLTGASLEVYNSLRSKIEAIAAGTWTRTSIELSMTGSFSGEADLTSGIGKAMDALMADLPADFYWYDKTAGYTYFSNGEGTKITKVIFAISENYVDANGDEETVNYGDGTVKSYKINVDSTKMSAAKAAVANAQAISAKYDGETDYKKMLGYKNEICGLVSYNHDAADDGDTPYGDPWQLVWVFDNDPATNVVCEGYSKAFQYLCDLSGIECYTVTGDMDGGGHMWNIVVLDGKSYHVDITNCDDGTIGYPDNLFLKGANFSDATSCFFVIDDYNNVAYLYDQDTVDMYSSAGILTVSTKDYDPNASGELDGKISIEVSPKTKSIAVGETFTLNVEVTATEDFVGIDGYLYFDYDDTVISVEDNGDGVCTVKGLAEGETELDVGWKPDEESGVTLENEIADTCTVTVTAAECAHEWGTKWENDKTYHWHVCTKCGEAGEKKAHEPGDEATEEASQLCTVCGYEIAPVLAHTHRFSTEWSKDENFHWHAATCGHTDEVKDKSTHNWDEGVITTEPTETSKGVKTYTCGVCGAVKTEPVSEIGHTHKPGTVWKYDAAGHWHECGVCSEKLDFSAHNVVSEVTKAPSASFSGTRRYYCSICGYIVREEVIPAAGGSDTFYPDYPLHPSGSPNVFPPSLDIREPKIDNGSGAGGWDSIANAIGNAVSGDSVQVDMNGTYELPKKVLKEIAGKNVDLVLKINDRITWTINGETVNSAKDVNMRARLNTKSIPQSAVEKISDGNSFVQLSLSHNGVFGFDAVMTVALGTRYDGMFANLLYYDPKAEELEFIDCGIVSNGKTTLDFSHASDYVIVLSSEPMGNYEDVSAASGICVNSSFVSHEGAVYAAVTVVLSIAAAVIIFRKRVRK